MAIERPMGFDPFSQSPEQEEAIEIDIVNPESVSVDTPDGGVIIDFDPNGDMGGNSDHNENLADLMEENDLREIASDLIGAFESDRDSRSDWESTYINGLDLLGLKNEDRSEPWDGACGVFHPVLTEAVVRFQAQAIQEIFPAAGPVKTSVVGQVTDEKSQQSARVRDYLNYLLTEKMTEYRSETEKMLFSLPLAGSAFRKVYYDPNICLLYTSPSPRD